MIKFVILFWLSIGASFAFEYNIQSSYDDVFDNSRDFVVEIEHVYKFKKKSFEAKMRDILSQLQKHSKLSEFKIDLKDHDQSLFIERYFKINSEDAYINEKGILIIKQTTK